jgi:outer membrane receptor protein involved in Fe transport
MPRVTLGYKLAPANMVYALYSRGVKSGRFSNITPPGGTQTVIFAKPEVLNNFEVGSKNTFLDNRIVINVAGFYDRVDRQQLTSTTPYTFVNAAGQPVTNVITATNNIGKSEIYGFELESSFKVTNRFSLDGSVGYAHQEFINSEPVLLQATSAIGFPGAAGSTVVMKGKTQANVPAWNGYAAAQYVLPLSYATLKFRADAAYRGKLYADLANLTEIRSSWTFNGRVTLSQDTWDLSVYGRNLLNNQRATGSGLAGATSTCGYRETDTVTYGNNQQCLYASPPRPLELGMEVAFRF